MRAEREEEEEEVRAAGCFVSEPCVAGVIGVEAPLVDDAERLSLACTVDTGPVAAALLLCAIVLAVLV